MKKTFLIPSVQIIIICASLFLTYGCGPSDDGKIPITTASDEAMQDFLNGRDLSENLSLQEARSYFEQAVEKDPEFALGYLYLANSQTSAKGFFEYLDKAVSLADKASEAERLWIAGADAGAKADPMKAREQFQKLVDMYPNDERAHNLLAVNYFGQQEFDKAIAGLKKSTNIAPEYAPPYNMLGYAHRQEGNYTEAEKAFKKYIDLIPEDPNPYDSYAELLLRMGKYDESITNYGKALEINPNFVNARAGIATCLNYQEKFDEARAECQKIYDMARDDGERRAAHTAMAVSYANERNMDKALEEMGKRYALAEKIEDAGNMSFDLNLMGNILWESGKYDEAMQNYENALKVIEESDLSQQTKDNTRLGLHYNTACVKMKKGDFDTAQNECEEYMNKAMAKNNPNQIRVAHQLRGMIALEEKNYDMAVDELLKSSQQNPYNLYRLAKAYQGMGNKDKAMKFCKKCVEINPLNSLNYAFIRKHANEMMASM